MPGDMRDAFEIMEADRRRRIDLGLEPDKRSKTTDYCDGYCTCPRCGGGPEQIKPEFRYLYWPNDWNPDGSRKNGKRL